MNHNSQSSLFELVTFYEESKREGKVPYFDEKAYHRLIDFYEREYLYQEALEVTNYAEEHYPFTVDFLLRRVHQYIFSKNLDEALPTLEKAISLDPKSLDVLLHRAWVMAEMHLFDQSLQILEDLKEEAIYKQELSLIHFYEGLVYELMHQLDQMFEALRTSISLDPSNQAALEKMWWCVCRTGKTRESIRLHKKVVDNQPYSAWGWFNLANAYEDLAEYELAIEAYEFAMVINEKFETAFRNCAEICLNTGKYAKALKYYEDVLKKFGEEADLYLKIGICYLKLDKISVAKRFLTLAEEEESFNEEIHYYLGECYARTKNWKKATFHYKQAISLFPEREEFYQGLAFVYAETGKFELASKFFKKATDIGPDIAQNWLLYATFLYNFGKQEEALEIIEEAQQYVEDIATLKYQRVAWLFRLQRNSEALYFLGDALEEDFYKYPVLFSMAPDTQTNPAVLAAIKNFENSRISIFK